MKKSTFLLLAWGALGLIPASARPYHYTPISWIVATRNNMSVDDRYVTIIGHVTRRIGDDEYWFTDGSGQIRLDSENFDLPIGPRLIVGGRIDQAYLGFGHIEVDVRRWRYAPLQHHPVVARTTMVTKRPAPAVPAAAAPAPTSAPVAAPATPATNTAPPLAPPANGQ
jgi:hypothetical protein